MKEVKIISLSGHIGSGKNYVADLAERQFGYKAFMLAGLVKSIVSQVEGVSLEELEDRKNKEKYRPLIIKYAEKMKEVDPFCFCKYVYHQIVKDLETNNSSSRKYLASDVRFPFESNYFRKLGRCSKCECEVEHIGIPGYDITFKSLYIESDLADKSSKHESESHYNYFSKNNDGVIFNGIEERYDKDRLINQLIKFL